MAKPMKMSMLTKALSKAKGIVSTIGRKILGKSVSQANLKNLGYVRSDNLDKILVQREILANKKHIKRLKPSGKHHMLRKGLFVFDYRSISGISDRYLVFSYGRELYSAKTTKNLIFQAMKLPFGTLETIIQRYKLSDELDISFDTEQRNRTLDMLLQSRMLWRRFVFNGSNITNVRELIV